MSAWARYNYVRGFAHLPFARCREYWGFKILHIKPQRVFTAEQSIFLEKLFPDKTQHQKIMLSHTNLSQWSLSKMSPITQDDEFEPANIEQRAFAFPMSWKFCPTCCREDRDKLGFSYWHRNHQLASVTRCDLHGDLLFTGPSLDTFDRLVLPHSLSERERSELTSSDNSNTLNEWSAFIYSLNAITQTNIDQINQWKRFLQDYICLPPRVQQKHVPGLVEKSSILAEELGFEIMAHVFRDYGKDGAKEPRVLYRLFPGMTYRRSETHPIYWTLFLFWAYKNNLLKGFTICDYPNSK
tara:strand:- start:28353 stop:29243 length:891 start_codon:yes stop_codon:yes gene_type:complete